MGNGDGSFEAFFAEAYASVFRGLTVAFRDPLYISTYLDDHGAIVEERHERLKDIFEPGVTRFRSAAEANAKREEWLKTQVRAARTP